MPTIFQGKVMAKGGNYPVGTVANPYRISPDIEAVSGSISTMHIKPNVTVTGAVGLTGLEVSPRFAAGCAGGNLRAILADPVLKAGTGNITGQIVAVECNFDFGTSGTRTITGDISALSAFLAIPSTYTYTGGHVSFLRVRTVNIKGWDSFLNVDDTGTGVTRAIGTGSDLGLSVYVGDTLYTILMKAV